MLHATALFADRHTAHTAVTQLVQAGFPRDALSVAMTDETREREFGGPASRSGIRQARYGGVFSAVIAGLIRLTTGPEPPLCIAGPLVKALHRTGAWMPALVALGLDADEARAVGAALRGGAIFVGVRALGDRLGVAVRLLELSGGSALQAA